MNRSVSYRSRYDRAAAYDADHICIVTRLALAGRRSVLCNGARSDGDARVERVP